MAAAQLPNYVQIEDNHSLQRHTSSMAIVNTDTMARDRYRANRDRILADKAALAEANFQIHSLQQQVSELRDLVHRCLARPIGATT